MRPKGRMAEPIVCVHVLVHAKKAGTLKIGATARFGCQDPQKGFFEQFAFSNTAARYEIVPLGWLMISEPSSTFRSGSRMIRSIETNGTHRTILPNSSSRGRPIGSFEKSAF